MRILFATQIQMPRTTPRKEARKRPVDDHLLLHSEQAHLAAISSFTELQNLVGNGREERGNDYPGPKGVEV